MKLDERLSAAAHELREIELPPVPDWSAPERADRARHAHGQRHWPKIAAYAAAAAAVLVGATQLLPGTRSTTEVRTPPTTSVGPPVTKPVAGVVGDLRSFEAFGLHVEFGPAWEVQGGTCPATGRITVAPAGARRSKAGFGCPSVASPWWMLEALPTSLDGINRACSPRTGTFWMMERTDGTPVNRPFAESCAARERPEPNTVRTSYLFDNLDLLLSSEHTEPPPTKQTVAPAAGPASQNEAAARAGLVFWEYADEALAPHTEYNQRAFVAERIDALVRKGCPALLAEADLELATSLTAPQCERLRPPKESVITAADGAYGTVPAAVELVTLTAPDGTTTTLEAIVRYIWQPTTLRGEFELTALAPYPSGRDPGQDLPTDPRFLNLRRCHQKTDDGKDFWYYTESPECGPD